MEQILLYFPINIVKIIEEAIKQNPQIEIYKKAIEIRIKTQKPIIIKLRDIDIIIQYGGAEADSGCTRCIRKSARRDRDTDLGKRCK